MSINLENGLHPIGKFVSMKALVLLLFTRIMLVSLAGPFQNLDFDGALTNKANLFDSGAGYSFGGGLPI